MNQYLRDAVYGFAVGDALGVPYEFKDRGLRCTDMIGGGTWGQIAGTWSDDTSLLLATCDSIKECKGINTEDMMYRFSKWLYNAEYTARGEVFDCGGTTHRAIGNYKNGTPIERCGERSNLSNGNGSLMRILPLAFIPHTFADIFAVSALTHAHEISCKCCLNYVSHILNIGRFGKIKIADRIMNRNRDEVRSSGYVCHSLEAALWCIGTSKSYTEAVLKAVDLGGDTDTIAALTGGLAGLQYGYDAIPEGWIDKLANKELIERCLF